jgi:Protein of unknown function (DUF2612)
MNVQAFDFSVNLLRALLWQYNDATRLEGLLREKQTWYDVAQSEFWTNWMRDVFDLRTANDFGLAVWAIILGLPLSVTPEDDPGKPIFGFAPDDFNFENGNFAASGNIVLTTQQRRIALRLRYYQLTTRHSVPQANAILYNVFGPGWGYVSDSLAMQIQYNFLVPLGPQLEFVLREYDLLPRPAGVGADFVVLSEVGAWGFGVYRKHFNQGNFYA